MNVFFLCTEAHEDGSNYSRCHKLRKEQKYRITKNVLPQTQVDTLRAMYAVCNALSYGCV